MGTVHHAGDASILERRSRWLSVGAAATASHPDALSPEDDTSAALRKRRWRSARRSWVESRMAVWGSFQPVRSRVAHVSKRTPRHPTQAIRDVTGAAPSRCVSSRLQPRRTVGTRSAVSPELVSLVDVMAWASERTRRNSRPLHTRQRLKGLLATPTGTDAYPAHGRFRQAGTLRLRGWVGSAIGRPVWAGHRNSADGLARGSGRRDEVLRRSERISSDIRQKTKLMKSKPDL